MSHGADSLKSILFALCANTAIALAKLAAALVTGSGAMLAESIHSFADAGNQSLLILGLKRAKIPPSEDYPLGYGKSIYFWSFIVAIILFSLGGLFLPAPPRQGGSFYYLVTTTSVLRFL